ncbi:MAG: ankyrin repeat domain-containing protein [Alphaproteobacteria bacterium]|nr:ankyrin repeat domain-containing protein [Alphaproteobacteria bacterium]
MKYIRLLLFMIFFAPLSVHAASNDFMVAAQLLSAAKNADIQQVQILINSGADVNYTDSTGLSLVCTALMNNDMRAAQILQMYGADASRCDRQIKNYNSRNKPKGSGGLFGGLSSAQSLTLAAAGAAVVIGGLFLLTDVFDPGNGNDNSGTAGNRPIGGDNSGGGESGLGKEAFALNYGPALPTAADEAQSYSANLEVYGPSSSTAIYKQNFELMSNAFKQNYLLMMHGYSPFARGYLGMRTLRNQFSNAPIPLSGALGEYDIQGGRPTNVALVTANGVNAAMKPAGDYSAGKDSLDDVLLVWTTLNDSTSLNGASNDLLSSKYYNNLIKRGTDNNSLLDDSTYEDPNMVDLFDLSGSNTAVQNASASNDDNRLAKVLGGSLSGYPNADYVGFMPNGQMTIFRTGGGRGFKEVSDDARNGTFERASDTFATGDTITLPGLGTLTLTMDGNKFTAKAAGDNSPTYTGYIGIKNNFLYFDSNADGAVDVAYLQVVAGDTKQLVLNRELGNVDYHNYQALSLAATLNKDGNGRSRADVLANASVIAPLYSIDTKVIDDILAAETSDYRTEFAKFVDLYYDRDKGDGISGSNDLPSAYAATLFTAVGNSTTPLLVFSTGGYETDSNFTGRTREATFENAAPLVFKNLEHLFMSVVAVGITGTAGTSGTDSIAGFSPSGKYALSQWSDTNGTTTTEDDTYYRARVCGAAGRGSSSIDPWCFASAGVNAEMAVASAAGAAGVVKSAFDYLDNKQVFALLALTADGPYLGTFTNGVATTQDSLRSYLQSMYVLPNEYNVRWMQDGEDYLDVFKEVFGYGLINLERATKPGTKVYYYNGTDIVSSNGDAYWRAASNTMFRGSSAFRPSVDKISAPFFDVLESSDGSLRMPRVWQNEFAVSGDAGRRALYMGDVLGELKTRDDNVQRAQIGNFGFSLMRSPRAYNDNLSGLDALRFDYSRGNWNLNAGYQHYLTDGASRFDGMANPILSMASNSIVSDAIYNHGRWSFGGRVFSGEITDEGLLENDPTVTSQFNPARLGLFQGGQSHLAWHGDKFGFTTAVGHATESNTILGAQTGGLLNLGGGDTTYIDTVMRYAPWDKFALTARATFARTRADASGDFILGMSDVDSNAFGIGLDWGNISLSVARPLAVSHGAMKYASAQYDVVGSDDGNYDLVIRDSHVADVDLRPDVRELRFAGSVRHNFGAFTDGALGFIYRVNPNNCDDYGNESIFMMKLTHRLGI